MSIIETKFRKGYVETPELRTNGIVCNKFEYTGDVTKESLGLPIFDETDQEEGTWYPVAKDLVMNSNPSGNGAFRYVEFPTKTGSLSLPFNAKIKKITQPQRTDTTGDVSVGVECYMVLYGKKSDESYHYICKSINKNVQRHQGTMLVWNFNNIEWNPKQEYERLLISLAEVPYAIDENGNLILENGNRVELDFLEAYGENGPLKHLHTESNGSKKYWVQSYTPIVSESGEKSYVPIKIGSLGSSGGSPVVMSTNSTGTQNFTPAFTITYTENELQPATIPHKENSQVHLTPSEKTKVLDVVPQFETHKQNLDRDFAEHKEYIQEFLYGEPAAVTEYDSKTVMGVTNTTAARIHFFFMGCENYTGTILQSITIPRPTNIALVGTGSTPDTAYVNPVWLYGLCYDENDELIDTIVSENSAQQLPDDGYKTTWLFNDRIKATYKKIKFGISLTDTPTESDTNPSNKTRIILCKTISKNGGWGTINQDNGDESRLTLDFQFVLKKETNTNVKGHIENTEIHVTQAERDRWNGYIDQLIGEVNDLKTIVSQLQEQINGLTNS